MSSELNINPEHEELWRSVLTGGHRSRYSFLPSSRRCIGCREPLAGIGGQILRIIGHRASRKNPNLCYLCDNGLPSGGAEVDTNYFLIVLQKWLLVSDCAHMELTRDS